MRSEISKQVENLVAADTSYSDILSLEQAELGKVQATLDTIAITGTDFTLAITTQYSYDRVKWFDHATKNFSGITHASGLTAETLDITTNAVYTRWKYVISGTDIDVDLELQATAI